MNDSVIKTEAISKMYHIGQLRRSDTLYASFNNWVRRLKTDDVLEEFWALRDIDFEVKQGEVVGIIGKNGAGKSTLLKILSRITFPTSGRFEITGRVASLLEVGTGFHPELSGRENIYLNGTILGLSRSEIKTKFDEIIEFSGIKRFIDTPIKHYSSGMYIRLAFSVAAHLEPDILFIDEVLAVGDAEFQQKCLGKMSNISHEGRTVLFVSHNLAAIENLCNRALLLNEGRKEMEDTPANVIKYYLENFNSPRNITDKLELNDQKDGSILQITFVTISSVQNNDNIFIGDDIRIEIAYRSKVKDYLENVSVLLIVKDNIENRLFVCNTKIEKSDFKTISPDGSIICDINKTNLLPGKYKVDLQIKMKNMVICRIENISTFDIIAGDFYGTGRLPRENDSGYFAIRSTWQQK